ncbi:MAG: helix-turn-helix transcriptional regulator [Magnetococcales bacterium]|nr:helix-turn-helix transcriptional regulator [Magnetococcales bacterium]
MPVILYFGWWLLADCLYNENNTAENKRLITNLVGTKIRSVRSWKKLTQKQLADLAGIPRATLATVERDDANPSLAVVFKIANALGMTIDQLVESSQRKIKHIPAATMPRVQSGDEAYRAVTVTPGGAFHFVQLIFELDAGGVFEGKPHPPGSEEYLYVSHGEVTLSLAGEESKLKQGDAACFHGNIRHTYRNPGSKIAIGVVSILTGTGKENSDTMKENS